MRKSVIHICFFVSCFLLLLPAVTYAQEPGDSTSLEQKNSRYSLLDAVVMNDPAMVKTLLGQGANPNQKATGGNSALMYAAEKGNIEIMKLLVEYGAEVNVTGFNDETPLFLAVFRNDFQAAKFLLEHGADPNVKDAFGITPLLYAAATNQYQSADLLIFYQAKTDVRDKDGNDALMAAVTFENLETSDILLQDGLDPNTQDKQGNTPSIVATQHGNYDILDLLLDYEADVNLSNFRNYTALAYAVVYNDVKASKMLLEKGADVNHKVDKGRNIYDLARIKGNDSIVNMIKERGGEPEPGLDFSEFNMTYGNSFNGTDIMHQFRGGLTDLKYGYYFETGIDFRPVLLRIQTVINDTLYQFRERRIGWSHGIGKYQKIYQWKNGIRLSAYGQITGLLSFPVYPGYSGAPGPDYTIIPSAGIALYGRYVGFRTGLEYYQFENLLDKGLKFNFSLLFRIEYPEIHYDRKEINWE